MRNVRGLVIVACIAVTLAAPPARSQTFSGVVTDSAGNVIPGAEARLASMDLHAVATVAAGANGEFHVTVPHAHALARRYMVELCAPRFAPAVEAVPLASSDTLVVRANLVRAKDRTIPVGTGACAWQSRGRPMTIAGGRGFALTAIRTARLADSIYASYPDDRAARAQMLRADESGWLHRMNAAEDRDARERAAWVLLGLAELEDTASAALLSQIRHALPPQSHWWQAGRAVDLLGPVETLFGAGLRDTSASTLPARRAARNYISRIGAAKYDPDMAAYVQQSLALFDLGMRDTAAVTRRARNLIAQFPGYTATKLAMYRFRWITPLRDGAPLPQFDIATLPGAAQARLTNHDLTAPYTLIVFWGTWCPHCIEELPALDSLRTEYHDHGLDIVSIAADDSPDVTSAFVRAHDMPWRQAYAGTTDDPFLQRIGVLAYPTTVLVDSTGAILVSNSTIRSPRAMVEKFLNR